MRYITMKLTEFLMALNGKIIGDYKEENVYNKNE